MQVLERIKDPLQTLVSRDHFETAYAVLAHFLLIAQRAPILFSQVRWHLPCALCFAFSPAEASLCALHQAGGHCLCLPRVCALLFFHLAKWAWAMSIGCPWCIQPAFSLPTLPVLTLPPHHPELVLPPLQMMFAVDHQQC